MDICVTGGAGMIGSHLVKHLVNNNHNVEVIDNLWRGKLENLRDGEGFFIDIDSNFHELDLSDLGNLSSINNIIEDVDVVVHLADIVAGIGYVFDKQYEIFRINNLINTNLFRATSQANLNKLIYVGTACSFPLELQDGLDAELTERDLFPANPESAYGWSKLIGQLELRYLAEFANFEINTLILHNVYGPNCEYEGERSQVIPSLINKAIEENEGGKLKVWGSGSQGRAFIHVNDVVEAISRTIHTRGLPDYMQIGPNHCTSIKELAQTIIEVSVKDLTIEFDLTKPEGDKGRFADYQRAKEAIGWEPCVDLRDGLFETYKWIESQKEKVS